MIVTASVVGALVKGTRVSLGLTQSALAERAKCSQRLISELEAGSTGASFGRLFDVFEALGIEVDLGPAAGCGAQEVERLAEEMQRHLASSERKGADAAPRSLEYYLSSYGEEWR